MSWSNNLWSFNTKVLVAMSAHGAKALDSKFTRLLSDCRLKVPLHHYLP